jgi:ribosomal protein S17E
LRLRLKNLIRMKMQKNYIKEHELELCVKPDEFYCIHRSFNINVKAIMNLSQVVAKSMIENKIAGSIVNLSSQVQSTDSRIKIHY